MSLNLLHTKCKEQQLKEQGIIENSYPQVVVLPVSKADGRFFWRVIICLIVAIFALAAAAHCCAQEYGQQQEQEHDENFGMLGDAVKSIGRGAKSVVREAFRSKGLCHTEHTRKVCLEGLIAREEMLIAEDEADITRQAMISKLKDEHRNLIACAKRRTECRQSRPIQDVPQPQNPKNLFANNDWSDTPKRNAAPVARFDPTLVPPLLSEKQDELRQKLIHGSEPKKRKEKPINLGFVAPEEQRQRDGTRKQILLAEADQELNDLNQAIRSGKTDQIEMHQRNLKQLDRELNPQSRRRR